MYPPTKIKVETLIECGADINSMDANGNYPLHLCIERIKALHENIQLKADSKAILQILLDKGAHTDAANYDGTTTPDGRYMAKNGRLIVTTPPEGRKIQQLWTTKDYSGNFTLKLEFRATPNADSGVFLKGKQLQCRDFLLAGPYTELKAFRPLKWNELIVRANGNRATCTVNGEIIEDNFQIPESGPFGLEGDRGQVDYRRLRIKAEN